MDTEERLPAPNGVSPFERTRRANAAGAEYWSRRDVAQVLGYSDYRNFEQAMKDDLQAADSLDCVGLFCPEPLFQTREAIDALGPGEVLEVLADDPAAEEDLTRFAKRTGHEVLLIEDLGDHKKFLIRKGR